MKQKKDYLELAEKQFYKLKEKTLDNERLSLGAESTEEYDIDGEKFKIHVDGFWEKSTWFNWTVYDNDGNVIHEDTKY